MGQQNINSFYIMTEYLETNILDLRLSFNGGLSLYSRHTEVHNTLYAPKTQLPRIKARILTDYSVYLGTEKVRIFNQGCVSV